MAATNKTTILELSQFVNEDKPSWLTDYNTDMEKIDTGVGEDRERLTRAEQSIIDHETRLATAEGEIDAIQELDTVQNGKIAALETESESLDNRTTALEDEVVIVNEELKKQMELIRTIANDYDATAVYKVGDYCIYNETLWKCITEITTGEPFDETKWQSVKVMDMVENIETADYGEQIATEAETRENVDQSLAKMVSNSIVTELPDATSNSHRTILKNADGTYSFYYNAYWTSPAWTNTELKNYFGMRCLTSISSNSSLASGSITASSKSVYIQVNNQTWNEQVIYILTLYVVIDYTDSSGTVTKLPYYKQIIGIPGKTNFYDVSVDGTTYYLSVAFSYDYNNHIASFTVPDVEWNNDFITKFNTCTYTLDAVILNNPNSISASTPTAYVIS